jgi:small subunit ribosomal protein S1
VFVQLEQGLEGLLHISELSDQKVETPESLVKVGDQIEVKVLRVDTADRKIGLSRKLNAPIEEEAAAGEGPAPTPREELKGGTGSGGSGPLFSLEKPQEENT